MTNVIAKKIIAAALVASTLGTAGIAHAAQASTFDAPVITFTEIAAQQDLSQDLHHTAKFRNKSGKRAGKKFGRSGGGKKKFSNRRGGFKKKFSKHRGGFKKKFQKRRDHGFGGRGFDRRGFGNIFFFGGRWIRH